MPASPPPESILKDVERISRLSAVPTLLKVVSETTGMRFSLIARVTPEHWVACAVHDEMNFGLKPGETLEVATTLCSQVRDTGMPVVMNQATLDPVYRNHPTPRMYGFESYIATPIYLADGEYFGTVCALDPRPADVNQPRILSMMKLFSELVSLQLNAQAREAEAQERLASAHSSAQLREQFIAVLGHDLRNPLSSVNVGADLLLKGELPEKARKTVQRIRASGHRMSLLVSDLMDFARARLGSGLGISLRNVEDVTAALRQVVAEVESAHPERTIVLSLDIEGAIRCDVERLGQLVSNLVSNAVHHGAPDRPIRVEAIGGQGGLRLAVSNEGPPIAADALPRLFQPYVRGTGDQKGLGLGLYIVNEIAKGHGGTLDVSSTADGTTFTFVLPPSAAQA